MGRQYVGIDLHRRRSVIVRLDEAGEVLETVRIDNDRVALEREVAKAGEAPEVVLEATYGWYWAVDVLQGMGASVHLAHPLGVKVFAYQRVKTDPRDAKTLADLLRTGMLPEAYVAPPALRELRELVRYRAKLVHLRSNLKSQVHAVLAKEGVAVPMADLFGRAGSRLLDELTLASAYRTRVVSLRRLIGEVSAEVASLDTRIAASLAGHPGYEAVQAIRGVGPTLAAVFVAEIGDVTRFSGPGALASWAGVTPRHHESDTKVHRGGITKQGSRLVRWAAVEAAASHRLPKGFARKAATIAERRGRKVARVALARKILTLVYYALRDGEIRSLAREEQAA